MKLVHVTIHTDHFDEELAFYTEHAGLHITRDMRSAGRKMVFLADQDGDTEIEIIHDPEAGNAGNDHLSIGFHTEDPEQKREQMIQAGFPVTPMITPNPHVRFFFTTDPAGVKVQFI